jgi:hypothetical protein
MLDCSGIIQCVEDLTAGTPHPAISKAFKRALRQTRFIPVIVTLAGRTYGYIIAEMT